MATERQDNISTTDVDLAKRPFSVTQRVYQRGYEILVKAQLDVSSSRLSNQLQTEEERLAAHFQKIKTGERKKKQERLEPAKLIAADFGLELVPVAVPVDYKKKMRKRNKENRHHMAQLYLAGDETHADIGKYYKATGERVRQKVKAAVKDLFFWVEDGNYPFEDLNFTKPLSDSVRDNLSITRVGKTAMIRKVLEKGATYSELRNTGFTINQLSGARRQLSKRQEPIPVPISEDRRSWKTVIEVLRDNTTERGEAKRLIKEIPRSVYHHYSKDTTGQPRVFVSISEVARKAGLFVRQQKGDVAVVSDYLERQDVPVGYCKRVLKNGKVTEYRFTSLAFIDEAIVKLEEVQGAQFEKMRLPTVKSRGPGRVKMPTTNDLFGKRKGQEYTNAFRSVRPYRTPSPYQLRKRGINFDRLIGKDPPVTVFESKGSFFVAKSDAERLKEYLLERLALID